MVRGLDCTGDNLQALFRKSTFPVMKRCFLSWGDVLEVRCLPCRKRCERDGKYLEARAASVRLAELKTQEAQRMRQAIMERQVLHSNWSIIQSPSMQHKFSLRSFRTAIQNSWNCSAVY